MAFHSLSYFVTTVHSSSTTVLPGHSLMSSVQRLLGFTLGHTVIDASHQDADAEVLSSDDMAKLLQFSLPYGLRLCSYLPQDRRVWLVPHPADVQFLPVACCLERHGFVNIRLEALIVQVSELYCSIPEQYGFARRLLGL